MTIRFSAEVTANAGTSMIVEVIIDRGLPTERVGTPGPITFVTATGASATTTALQSFEWGINAPDLDPAALTMWRSCIEARSGGSTSS
jgi:hypothetical protein